MNISDAVTKSKSVSVVREDLKKQEYVIGAQRQILCNG